MEIKYIINLRMPTEKAYGYQIAKTCEEFALAGQNIELIAPTRNNKIKDDVFAYYGIKNKFKTTYIKSYDWLVKSQLLGRLSFYLQEIWFLAKLIFLKFAKETVILTRNPEIAWLFSQKGNKVYFEAHNWPQSKTRLFKYFLKNCRGIISNSKGTANAFQQQGFKNILVAPNGVDLNDFNIKESQEELRRELGLPLDRKIVMYSGHLYDWKGVDTILEAALGLKTTEEILIILVGGTKDDIKKYQDKIIADKLENVLVVGHQPHKLMPKYLSAADILLLPNKPVTTESTIYTSPIKCFEYMAAGRPIIASDLPSIKEILDERSALFFQAGDADDLAAKIKQAITASEEAQKRAEKAKDEVKKYSWQIRTRKILDFIKDTKKADLSNG